MTKARPRRSFGRPCARLDWTSPLHHRHSFRSCPFDTAHSVSDRACGESWRCVAATASAGNVTNPNESGFIPGNRARVTQKKAPNSGKEVRRRAVCNCPDSHPGHVAVRTARRSRAAFRWSAGSWSREKRIPVSFTTICAPANNAACISIRRVVRRGDLRIPCFPGRECDD